MELLYFSTSQAIALFLFGIGIGGSSLLLIIIMLIRWYSNTREIKIRDDVKLTLRTVFGFSLSMLFVCTMFTIVIFENRQITVIS